MLGKTPKRSLGALVLTLAFQTLSLGVLPKSEAKDLTDVLIQGYPLIGGSGATAAALGAFAPAFAQAIAQAVTQEVPLVSVAPAFSYRYNPTLSIFERSSSVPGPLFSERALTLGKGQWNFSVGYAFIDFSDINGTSLDNIRSPGLFQGDDRDSAVPSDDPRGIPLLQPGETLVADPIFQAVLRTRIDLNAHIIASALRYGITENWDVSVVIPIVDTFLRVRNELIPVVDADFSRAHFLYARDAQGNLRRLRTSISGSARTVPFTTSRFPSQTIKKAAGSSTGVGDISLRTKYHLWRTEGGGAALGLNLQLPSGEVRDFHGTDETHLSTFVYLSQIVGERIEPHLNLGVDFNTDDVDRSSLLYTVGTTVLMWRKLGLVVDFLGRHEFEGLRVSVPSAGLYRGALLDRDPKTCTNDNPCFFSGASIAFPFFPIPIKRNDIADFSFGLRYALGTGGSLFFGGIIPLNDDGFRADFIPSGGLEYTF